MKRRTKYTRSEAKQLFDKLASMSERQAEAFLNTPEGELARQAFNVKILKANPRKRRAKKAVRRRRRPFVKHLRMKPRKRSHRETLTRNPTRTYLIEVCVAKTVNSIQYMWWNDSEQRFTTKRSQASPYKSEHAARIEAKKLLPRLPSIVRTLRTIPA